MLVFLASLARRLVGLAALTGLLAGAPYTLITYLGWPLPEQVPSWHQVGTTLTSPLTDQMLGNLLVCLLWAAWAAFAWSVLAEFTAALAGIRLPQPRALAPARGLATLLITMITGGVLASTALAASTSFTAPAQASPTTTLAAVDSHHSATPPAVAAAREAVVAPPVTIETESRAAVGAGELTLVAAGREYTHTVKRGDTLSDIAQLWLGDANRWPEIFALNRGTHFPDVGGTLTNPNLIYPGWTLELPDDAVPPHAHQLDPTGPAAEPPEPDQPCAQTPPEPPTATGPGAPATPTQPDPAPSTPAAPPPPAAAATAIPDDGVVGPVPTGTAASATESAPANATASPDPAASPTAERHRPRGVALPSGSWIDLGLALAIAAAVALVWAHRRHRYTRRPPSAQLRLDDPDLAPMPRVLTQIRRGLRRPTPQPPAATAGSVDLDAAALPDALDVTDVDEDVDDEATVDDDEFAATVGQDDDGDRPDAVPVVPSLANPISAVWPPAGLGLTGPGAQAAARGFLTAALAAGGLEHPNSRTWAVMPSATAATLLGTAAVRLPDTPRLTVTAGLDEALELLEAQTLHRTRLVYRHEVDDVAALRAADPFEEPLPPILLLADTTGSHERTRIAALLAQGQRLDIHGVLLGPWPDGDTVVVAADGTTSPASGDTPRHGRHPADIGRLTVLDPTETADLLTTLAESHTGRAQAPAPAETTPGDTADPPPANTRDATAPVAGTGVSAQPITGGRQDVTPIASTVIPTPPAGDVPGQPADDGLHAGDGRAPSLLDGERPAPLPGRVQVTILGHPKIVNANPHRSLRAKSLELLVYLAVHDGAASTEAILDDLLPDAPSSKATHRLHTYVSDLRTVLRHTGGPGSYITHPDQRYVLNPERIDIDLWRMRAAIREADTAPDRQTRITALRRAVDTYRRPLADGCDYEWIEPYREGVRRQVLDACLALAADLDDQPTEQLTVLETAIGHHPYAEPLYQAAMRAHAQLGHLDAIRTLRRTLTRRLADIDAEPSNDSITLADRLVAQLQRPGRDTRLRRSPGPGDGAAA